MRLAHLGATLASFCLFLVQSAQAADMQIITVCNTTGLPASDLHITFSGTGGTVTAPPAAIFSPGCPVPAVPSNGAVTNTVVVDWGMPCVAPGSPVTLIVSTPNGPLGAVSGFWTSGGVPIGPIRFGDPKCFTMGPVPVPPPGPPPFNKWVIKWQVRCQPLGPIKYTPWKKHPNGFCWMRKCCIPRIRYWVRPVLCFMQFRFNRFIETGVCRPIGPWRPDGVQRARKRWRIETRLPPGGGPPGGGQNPKGPPKNPPGKKPPGGPPDCGSLFGYQMNGMELAVSDDNGQSWRRSKDMIGSFFDIFADIAVIDEDDGSDPPYDTFEQVTQRLAPNYQKCAQHFLALGNEITQEIALEPNAQLQAVRNNLNAIGNAFLQIAPMLATSNVNNANPFNTVQFCMDDIATRVQTFPSLRFPRMAENLRAAAQAMRVARDNVLSVLDTDDEKNAFIWALCVRFEGMMQMIGESAAPHIAIQLDLGSYEWRASSVDMGVDVLITDPTTGELIDQMNCPMSDYGRFFVPLFNVEQGQNIRIAWKYDTFLSNAVTTLAIDGTALNMMPAVNGDVNGDDVIDGQDLARVAADQGMGGLLATETPPSDLNCDGIVDPADHTIVQNSIGQIGQGFKELYIDSFFDVFVDLEIRERRTVDIEIRTGSGAHQAFYDDVQVGPDGRTTIWLPANLPGTKMAHVKPHNGLAQNAPFVQSFFDVFIELPPFKPGDSDGDNQVTLLDYDQWSNAFDSVPGDPNWDDRCDFDGDGAITLLDFDYWSENYDQVGDP